MKNGTRTGWWGMGALLLMAGISPAAEDYPGLDRAVITLPETVQQAASGIYSNVVVYTPQAPGKHPLILFLHGAGKTPEEANQAEYNSVLARQSSGYGLPFHIVHPRAWRGWNARDLDALLDYVVATYEVDEQRIYVGGFSMGGHGTWTYAFEGKRPAAAIFPMASGAGKNGKIHEKWDLEKLKDMPTWMFHGELDKAVPYANAKETAELMKQINPQFKFTSFPELGHNKGDALIKRDLYDWLLAQSRAVPVE